MIADDHRRSKKVCDHLRSYGNMLLQSSVILLSQRKEPCSIFCDYMETKVLRSAIETYPMILFSNKARILVCSNRLFVVNITGIKQHNVSNKEFMEEGA